MKIHILIPLIFLLTVLAYFALDNNLIVRNYTVYTDKIDKVDVLGKGDSLRFVVLADIHSRRYNARHAEIVALVKEQKPDAILLAGDIIDSKPKKTAYRVVEEVAQIAPTYYATGNHEMSLDVAEHKKTVEDFGVTVLDGAFCTVDVAGIPLIIAGIDDPRLKFREDRKVKLSYDNFALLDNNPLFKILIAHRPEHIDVYKEYSFDLVVSGHLHGGMVRIPYVLNGLVSPSRGLFPKYAGGAYEHDRLTHIVSRGLAGKGWIPRIFNPPEVVVITICNS